MKKSRALLAFGFSFAFLACFPAQPASAGAQTSPPPAKKVWDNDDVEALRTSSVISVAGATYRPAPPAPQQAGGPAADDRAKKAKKYRDQLQPLYAQLPKIDAQIAEMQHFQDGSYQAPAGLPLHNGGRPLNPADQIDQLEKHRREVVARIGDIEDQARHAGVLPGDLR
jgi:hypothetical protein